MFRTYFEYILCIFLSKDIEILTLRQVFTNIEKSCPRFEFLDKKGLEFLPEGQKLSFFGTLVFAKMLKKSLF